MVVTRCLDSGFELGSGAGSQDRPALSVDRVGEIVREEVIGICPGSDYGDVWVYQDRHG